MISVALCTFNGEKFIAQQLQSIVNQTIMPDEIIVCDDCSKDRTVNIIRETLKDYNGHWQFVCNQENLGYKKNFEKAIGLCQGDIIFLSDQDDVWHPHKIELMNSIFLANPDVALVFHDAEVVNENLRLLNKSFWELLHFNYQDFLCGNYSRLFEGNVIQGAACAFRKAVYRESLPFFECAIHDEWLALNAVNTGVIYPLPEALLKYRQTGSNEIGSGRTENIWEKSKKWKKSYKVLLIDSFKEIIRKKDIWTELVKRFHDNGSMGKVSNREYLTFLERRIGGIVEANSWKLPSPHSYIYVYDNVRLGIKAFVKDCLCILFLSKRSIIEIVNEVQNI